MAVSRVTSTDRLVLAAVCASPEGTLYGAKKLHKLFFIAHYPRPFDLDIRRPLRSLRFRIFRFGPFAQELYDSIDRLVEEGLIEVERRELSQGSPEVAFPDDEDEGDDPHKLTIYRATPHAEEEIRGADEYDVSVIRKVVRRWGWLTSNQIEALVCDRTGLTADLKVRYQRAPWEDFDRFTAKDRSGSQGTIPDGFWLSQQVFLRDLRGLLAKGLMGKFVAYIGDEHVATGEDEVEVYEGVLATHGRAPDFVGFVSATGRRVVDAFAA